MGIEKGMSTLDEVGVISPYRAQVDHLKEMFEKNREQLTALRDAVAPAVVAAQEGRAIDGKVALGTGSLVAIESTPAGSEGGSVTAPSALSAASGAGASAAVLSLDVSTVDKYQGR